MASKIIRPILHILVGVAVILLLLFVPRPLSLIILFLIFLISVLFSIIAIKNKVPIISSLAKKLGKEDEKKFPGKGFIFLFAGALLTAKLFPQNIALASIIILVFGDSTASLSRKAWGEKFRKGFKGFAGIFTGLVISFFVALLFVPAIYAGIGAIIGMLAEAISIKLGQSDTDDNLIIPLAVGTVLYIISLSI